MSKQRPQKRKQQPQQREVVQFDEIEWACNQLYNTKASDKFYKKLDAHQLEAYECLISKQFYVVLFDEKAGCGKTTLAWLAGLNMLRTGEVSKVVYLRVSDERAMKHGFVKGDLEEKEAIYMQPAYDACLVHGIQPQAVDALRQKGIIEFCTDATMRGVNLTKCFVIVDEPQNADLETLRLILTRLHDSCKSVLSGHSGQMDSRLPRYGSQGFNAFEVYQLHFLQQPWAVKCALPNNYRGKVSRWADEVEQTVKNL